MPQLPELLHLLNYKNPLVIERFKINFPKLNHKAEEIFINMLKYLWLCKKLEIDKKHTPGPALNFNCIMHREMQLIDEMWHTFILITKDYALFCETYFGEFIHHVPNLGNVEIEKNKFAHELELFLSYVYDHLGEDTVMS